MALTTCGHESTRGTTLLLATSAAGPFIEVGAVEVMPNFDFEALTDECTDPYGGGANGWKTEYKTGEFDGGDASFTVNWISGNALHDDLFAYFEDTTTPYHARLALSDVNATEIDFPYLIKRFGQEHPAGGGKITRAITGKVNGRPVGFD